MHRQPSRYIVPGSLVVLIVAIAASSGAEQRADSKQQTQPKENVMNQSNAAQPRIARIWRGRTTRAKADEYARYLYEAGIKPLEKKALGVQSLREDRETESEFVTISYWENIEAMSRFTGGDPRRIHHLDRDAEFLIELPQSVQVLEIVSAHGRTGGS
jgi:hypothetical protein